MEREGEQAYRAVGGSLPREDQILSQIT